MWKPGCKCMVFTSSSAERSGTGCDVGGGFTSPRRRGGKFPPLPKLGFGVGARAAGVGGGFTSLGLGGEILPTFLKLGLVVGAGAAGAVVLSACADDGSNAARRASTTRMLNGRIRQMIMACGRKGPARLSGNYSERHD